MSPQEAQPPPPPPAGESPLSDLTPGQPAPANITIVQTAMELQQACLTGAVDIEIRAHLDLRGLVRPLNPVFSHTSTASDGAYPEYGENADYDDYTDYHEDVVYGDISQTRRLALLYSSKPLRSIRVGSNYLRVLQLQDVA